MKKFLKLPSLVLLSLIWMPFFIFAQKKTESELKTLIKKSEGKEKGQYLYRLAKLYESAPKVKANSRKRIRSYQDASKLGSDSAQYELGLMYEHGNSLSLNPILAKNYYELAVQKKHNQAILALARLYQNGAKGLEKNFHKAIEYYLLAWNNGSSTAELELDQVSILNLYFSDEKVNKTYLLYLASKGYNEYIYSFALISEQEGDYERAYNFYSKAAANDYWPAYHKLALFHEKGWYTPQSTRQAIIYYLKAANKGIEGSQEALKNFNITKYVTLNNIDYLHYTADTGNVASQYKLYLQYSEGKNVPKDISKALIYCQKAALGRNTDAMYTLGIIYREGELTDKDYKTSFRWFRKAAYLGHPVAKYELAEMYINQLGTNLPKEKTTFWAIKWYLNAANEGVEKALLRLNKYDLDKYILSSDLAIIKYKANRGYKDEQFRLGIYYKNQLNDSNAVYWLKKAYDNGKIEATLELADIYAKGKCKQDTNYMLAYDWYKLAKKNKLKNKRLNIGLAYLFFQSEQYKKDSVSGGKSLDNLANLVNKYIRVLDKGNVVFDLEVYKYLGNLYFADSNYTQAIVQYTNYIKQNKSEDSCTVQLAKVLYKRSHAFVVLKSYKSALTDLDYALILLKNCPDDDNLKKDIYYIKGDLALNEKNQLEACKYYLKAEELGQELEEQIKNICNFQLSE